MLAPLPSKVTFTLSPTFQFAAWDFSAVESMKVWPLSRVTVPAAWSIDVIVPVTSAAAAIETAPNRAAAARAIADLRMVFLRFDMSPHSLRLKRASWTPVSLQIGYG